MSQDFTDRIGTKDENGRVLPAFTITGMTYEPVNCTICGLGDGVHFVVLPANFTDDEGLIEQARQSLGVFRRDEIQRAIKHVQTAEVVEPDETD